MPHSSQEGSVARQEESSRLLSRLGASDFVILLDERGILLSSPRLSETIIGPLGHSQTVSVIIGGAYGVDETIRQRAHLVLSLSPLVFPHQLVRLLLVEQLYRSQEIIRDGQYHHE